MKIKILIISFVLLLSINNVFAEKLKTITSSGACPSGSVNNSWTASWTYNEKGKPMTGAGIDCDGNPWSIDLRSIYPGPISNTSESVKGYISSMDASVLQVEANDTVKFRIVDIQTGIWVSNEILYTTPDTNIDIDIHYLPNGIYGLVVIFENSVNDMIQFLK
jgi:hypothetical protein